MTEADLPGHTYPSVSRKPLLVENRRIKQLSLLWCVPPVNQGIFSDVHRSLKICQNFSLVSADSKAIRGKIDCHNPRFIRPELTSTPFSSSTPGRKNDIHIGTFEGTCQLDNLVLKTNVWIHAGSIPRPIVYDVIVRAFPALGWAPRLSKISWKDSGPMFRSSPLIPNFKSPFGFPAQAIGSQDKTKQRCVQ